MRGFLRSTAASALATGLAFAGLAAVPAHAEYWISDTAGAVVCCVVLNNYTSPQVGVSATLQTNVGAYVHSTPNYDPVYGGIASVSTTDVTNLTSGSVSAFMPGAQGKYPILMPAAATAFASSDFTTGEVHAYASSEIGDLTKIVIQPGGPPVQTDLTAYYSQAFVLAQYVSGFTTSNTSDVDEFLPFTWEVHGSYSGPILPYKLESFLQVRADYNNYTSYSQGILDYKLDDAGQLVTNSDISDEFWTNSFSVVDLGGGNRRMTALLDIKPGTGIGSLWGRLEVQCGEGAICDYSHTSSLSIGPLPDGVSINFDAPGFLSGKTTAAVPEPGVWALMLLGFGGAGAALRRRRRAASSEDAALAA